MKKTNHPPVEYSEYLQLDKILTAQKRLSLNTEQPAHDESLFIIIHQVYELWFKEILIELKSIIKILSQEYVLETQMYIVVNRMKRILEIQRILIQQIKVLETMTPLDFLEFRDLISPASGFQSAQFREIENRLGLSRGSRAKLNETSYETLLHPEERDKILDSENSPSLLFSLEKWLERNPFVYRNDFQFAQEYQKVALEGIDRDRKIVSVNSRLSDSEKKKELLKIEVIKKNIESLSSKEVYDQSKELHQRKMSYEATLGALFISIYDDYSINHLPHKLIIQLVELDESMTTWRYRHALLALRMIGQRIGTGGTSGYDYLRMTLEKHKVFQDLATLSTYLIPRIERPLLPQSLESDMGFRKSFL
ncbi:MAG: tryptophan 2,3-dioxygenase [Bdellovibrionaceae bacterium]|nr:tryptophan 2,3-dioxygenase [Pseudobdellovibrionaceae bacterium]|tara:strand:- start:8373 stop:9470 length:1098 start_codon:yes stop_codon:yes gene_type:complete